MSKVIVAPKRECRDQIPANWQEQVSGIKGIRILGRQPRQMQIEATAEAVQELHVKLESKFHIELAVRHSKL